MENGFTEQDSLRVINQMINQARNNYRRGAGSYCIFWGYLIACLSLLNFALLHIFISNGIDASYSSYVWWVTIPIAVIYFIYVRNSGKKQIVVTHIDNIIYSIWLGFGVSCFLFLFVLNLFAHYYQAQFAVMLITPVILLLTGMGQFASGAALKFRIYFFSSGVFWLGSLLSMLLLFWVKRGDLQFIVMAVSMIFGFCVPGHLLNKKAEKNV